MKMDERDKVFLMDFRSFSGSNRLVAAIAIYQAGLQSDSTAVQVHSLLENLGDEEAAVRARELRTASRIQSIAVARLIGELVAQLEDLGGLAIAIRDRDVGLFRRYLRSSAGEVDSFFDSLLELERPRINTLLGLPSPDAAADLVVRERLTGWYNALEGHMTNAATAYRLAGESVVWEPSGPAPSGFDDHIKVVLDVAPWSDSQATRGLLAQVVNKIKHRFAVVENLEGLSAARGGIRFAHYRRDPEAVTQVFRSIVSVASTAIALADLVLYVDDLGLDPAAAAHPSASPDDTTR
jgi:hypothetical protein